MVKSTGKALAKQPNVIILIMSHKEHLEPYEVISMKQCYKILGHYPIKFICPKGLNVEEYLQINPEASFDFIPSHWQSTYINALVLKTVPFLFKRYQAYDYILFHELDAFVFKDELMEWCRKGYSFIGAPWLGGWEVAEPSQSFIGVGNGGFSLRNVRDHLRAISSFSYIEKPAELWQRLKSAPVTRKPYLLFDMTEKLTIRNNTNPLFNDWLNKRSEDTFWGMVVAKNFEWFNVADPLEAMQFSFEVQPQHLYALNNNCLPFGCHAWWKYGLEFWRPIMNDFGYNV